MELISDIGNLQRGKAKHSIHRKKRLLELWKQNTESYSRGKLKSGLDGLWVTV